MQMENAVRETANILKNLSRTSDKKSLTVRTEPDYIRHVNMLQNVITITDFKCMKM
jgi:hypothetical protein